MKEETLLEQMTRVRPEVLNEETLKLFNKIMEVIDERDKLIEENKRLKEEYMLLSNSSDEYEDKLQERIDKAIKYIKETNFWGLYDDTPMQEVLYGEELLKILGGDVDDE